MFDKWKQKLAPHKKGKSMSPSSTLHGAPGSLKLLDSDNDASTSTQSQQNRIGKVLRVSKATLRIMEVLMGAPAIGTLLETMDPQEVKQAAALTREDLQDYCYYVMDSITQSMEKEESKTSPKLHNSLKVLYSMMSEIHKETLSGESNTVSVDEITRKITRAADSFMLLNSISGVITMTSPPNNADHEALSKLIRELPYVAAAHDDSESKKKNGLCFDGTREALLQDVADWVSALYIVRIYMLCGIAGVGKSTVAFTVAERAKQSGYLGASFFFSRDAADRSNAKKFFLTIAYQLCLYDKEFAQAIDRALRSERGTAAVTKDPQEQLEALIVDPLRDIVKSRSSSIVVVVDALDECDDQDGPVVLANLHRLVQELPYFKIFLTTRPQSHLPSNSSVSKVFHLQNVEDKIVNNDIKLYLKYNLSSEQVALRMPSFKGTWSASNEEIESLVEAAGRLFIMAATAVRFILDMTIYDPSSQMEALKVDFWVTLDGLESFYGTILRRAVPPGKAVVAHRFKTVIGTILITQEPLPLKTLEHLAQPYSASAIEGVLANLQSVITVNNDIPRIYHKSFYDFLTDANHCAQEYLIDIRSHHTRIATRCFQIMDNGLKRNILGLGIPARFMPNQDGLAAENITQEQLDRKIPAELQYACIYWANHLEAADTKDPDLQKEVETFVNEHLMHWLEVLSWVCKLSVAYNAIRALQKLMSFASSNLDGIISDALHFIPRFYQVVERSALHTYYSALSFTPTERPLFKQYREEMEDNPLFLEGVPAQWDPMISDVNQGHEEYHLVFSQNSSKFASFSANKEEMRLWDAENMAPIRTFNADRITLANDFSTVASLRGTTITLLDVESSMPMAHTFEHSIDVHELALSFDGSRLAAGLSDGTVSLWDGKEGQRVASLKNYTHDAHLKFAPTGYTLAFGSDDGSIELWDGVEGLSISKLEYESKKHVEFVFSRNSARLAALVEEDDGHSLLLWNARNGKLISSAKDAGWPLAISDDGSFIVTGGSSAQMWKGNPLRVVDTVDMGGQINSMTISRDILAIVSTATEILAIYDTHNCTLISKLQKNWAEILALSPDCARLATGNSISVTLWDVPNIRASALTSTGLSTAPVHELAFSPDCSRLASGCRDGTIELWNTNQSSQPIASYKAHSTVIAALAFSLDGERFASGSWDNHVKFWNGKDGTPVNELEHVFPDGPIGLAFSTEILACGAKDSISLWDRSSLDLLDTLEYGAESLSFSTDGSLLTSADERYGPQSEVMVWNVKERASIAVFTVNSGIEKLVFSPSNTWIAIQSAYDDDGSFKFFSIHDKKIMTDTEHDDLSWIPHLDGAPPISWRYDDVDRSRLLGRFSDKYDRVPMLCVPGEMSVYALAVGSAILAVGSSRGSIFFIRSSATSFN